MARKSLSVLKRARQSEKNRIRNRRRKQSLKKVVKEVRAAGSGKEALELLPKAQSVIDKSARKHLIHRNAARRLKARLAREAAEQE